ncbi:acyltransferase [Taibaiella koreensis]|uniref:acyltransferase n=1 Tax=Taibaiella koreensis TaxID=1268548 RepID=UPI000E5A05AF|nr:acyltransferase [Taibaiella koreensis]
MKKLFFRVFERLLLAHQQRIYTQFRQKYDIDKDFRFNGKDILMYGEGTIVTGADSYVGEYSTWQAAKGYKIVIGQGCMISHNVRCYTQSAIPDYDFSIKPIPEKYGDVIIGDYVWIGANAFINPGIRIGNNSVIGANSVVTKDVAENAIVGGVPARLIRYKQYK